MQVKEFDHTVEVRDARTGQVIARNDYILRVGGSGKEYERPPHSGLIYDPQGVLIRDEGKEKRELLAAQAKVKAETEEKSRIEKIDAERKLLLADALKEAEEIKKNALKEAESIKAQAAKKGQ